MHLPAVVVESGNESIYTLWYAFSSERRDIRTENLPMMDSVFWPIGFEPAFGMLCDSDQLFFRHWIAGRVFLLQWVSESMSKVRDLGWIMDEYPIICTSFSAKSIEEVLTSSNNCNRITSCLLFSFNLTLCILDWTIFCHILNALLWGKLAKAAHN